MNQMATDAKKLATGELKPIYKPWLTPDSSDPTMIAFRGLGELLYLPFDRMGKVDIGLRNLLCASLLPDTQDLDIPACLATLDSWAMMVKRETQRYLPQFHMTAKSHQGKRAYKYSEAYWRAMMMITVLQKDLGVRYNAAARDTMTFASSREGFIHGLLTGDRTGTCANMPVLYAAIGRRLNYPIFIVSAKGHLFNRWKDAKTGDRFNIEGSSLGMSSQTDEYYMSWPRKMREEEVYHGIFLRDMYPLEEMGAFMATRGHCLRDKGHLLDSITAYAHAHRLDPTCPYNLGYLLDALNKELNMHKSGELPQSYRQAETIDGMVDKFRFTLNSDYTDRPDTWRPGPVGGYITR